MRRRRWQRWLCLFGFGWLALLGCEHVLELLCPYPLARLRAMPTSTVVTDAHGEWLCVTSTPAHERVLPTHWRQVSPALRHALLASEDSGFFDHGGVDFGAALRALLQDAVAGRVVSGASTLTMQCVRIVEPRPRTFANKLVEMLRARQLERQLGKEQILDLWLTQVPMGGTLRGLEAASRYWYGKSASGLDAAEAAALVAMVPAPSARAPDRHGERLRQRRDALLQRMARRGDLAAEALAAALQRPLGAARHRWPLHAPHLCAQLLAAAPQPRPEVVPSRADLALHERLRALLLRQPLPGDGVAVVVLERDSGALRALLGSRDFAASQLDAATCRRSLGSTLKPFLYALAVEVGAISSSAPLDDAPMGFGGWRPANFHRGFAGRIGADLALATSANLPAVHGLQRVGTEAFAELLRRLGLPIDARGVHLDAALGTSAASPLQLARAFQQFVSAPGRLGLSTHAVDWTLRAMSQFSPAPGRCVPGRLAWKSGTSSGCRDAWCVGITADSVIVVWLGNRDGRGDADLVGIRTANALLADVAAAL